MVNHGKAKSPVRRGEKVVYPTTAPSKTPPVQPEKQEGCGIKMTDLSEKAQERLRGGETITFTNNLDPVQPEVQESEWMQGEGEILELLLELKQMVAELRALVDERYGSTIT